MWLALFVLAALPAHATILEGSFAGSMTEITDPSGYLDSSIVVGSLFSVSYEVDTFGVSPYFPAEVPNSTTHRFFLPPASPGTVSALVESSVFSVALDVIFVGDDAAVGGEPIVDYWSTGVLELTLFEGFVFPYILASDSTGTRLDSQDLFALEDLVGWNVSEVGLVRVTGLEPSISVEILARGTMTSVIPEPGTAGLLLLGLVGVGMRQRRA